MPSAFFATAETVELDEAPAGAVQVICDELAVLVWPETVPERAIQVKVSALDCGSEAVTWKITLWPGVTTLGDCELPVKTGELTAAGAPTGSVTWPLVEPPRPSLTATLIEQLVSVSPAGKVKVVAWAMAALNVPAAQVLVQAKVRGSTSASLATAVSLVGLPRTR